jgi:hypothetical protein
MAAMNTTKRRVWQRQDQVNRRHDDRVDPATEVACDAANDQPERRRQEDAEEAHGERNARAVDHPAVNVAAEVVGAEGMVPRAAFLPHRGQLARAQVLLVGGILGDHRRKEGCKDDDAQQDDPDDAAAVAPE